MRFLILRLLCAFLVLGMIHAHGQTQSTEPTVEQLNLEIARLVARPPRPEMASVYAISLRRLRSQKRDLLLQKKGDLLGQLRDLQANNASTAYREYLKALQTELARVNDELNRVTTVLETGSAPASLSPTSADNTSVENGDSDRTTPMEQSQPEVGNTAQARPSVIEREAIVTAAAAAAPIAAPTSAAAPTPLADNFTATNPVSPVTDASGSYDCNEVILHPKNFTRYVEGICFLARNIVEVNKQRDPAQGIVLARDQTQVVVAVLGWLLTKKNESSFILEAEEARTDKQTGGGPGAAGTTSLVVKGGAPAVFGWAVENGAAVANRSGTTITFRFNPLGTFDALANKGYITSFKESENDGFKRFLRKTSVGFSFDANRGNDAGTFTGSSKQISAFSAKYEFINERDPRHSKYREAWAEFIATKGVDFTKTAAKSFRALETLPTEISPLPKFKNQALQAWLEKTNLLLAEISVPAGLTGRQQAIKSVQEVLKAQLDVLPVDELEADSNTLEALTNYASGFEAYLAEKKKLLDEIAKGTVVSFEYTNNREVNTPDTSNFRFVAEKGPGGRWDLTANASLTIFNKKVTNSGRLRDFQFAGQIDVPLGDPLGFGQSMLSFAGRYERLLEDAMDPLGNVIANTKGDIGHGQLKWTLPIKGTGLKIPFSVTFSNRSELIKEKDIRGSFGFTFDLDSLFARFKPF